MTSSFSWLLLKIRAVVNVSRMSILSRRYKQMSRTSGRWRSICTEMNHWCDFFIIPKPSNVTWSFRTPCCDFSPFSERRSTEHHVTWVIYQCQCAAAVPTTGPPWCSPYITILIRSKWTKRPCVRLCQSSYLPWRNLIQAVSGGCRQVATEGRSASIICLHW